jgi:HTH-type transcriptional repressor of NAD biosynthesis genes
MEKTITTQIKSGLNKNSFIRCKRFVLVGAESTGKSTLAADLVDYFRKLGGDFSTTMRVDEYGREYTIQKLAIAQEEAKKLQKSIPGMDSLVWTEQDFIHIAIEQNRLEDEVAKSGSQLVICDTDTFATAIWFERYLQCWSETLEKMIQELPARALYLLADHAGIPFEADEIRDGEHLRPWMTRRFEQEMTKRNYPYIKLHGNRQERFKAAVEAIKQKF